MFSFVVVAPYVLFPLSILSIPSSLPLNPSITSTILLLPTVFFLKSTTNTLPNSLVVYTLHHGPKQSIISASVLILLGNWIRYAGTRGGGGKYGVVMFGQILTGLAQPFVLAAPTRYSDLWFTESGRVSATAVASLANPLGGAVSFPFSSPD